jgi:hypothetical protein
LFWAYAQYHQILAGEPALAKKEIVMSKIFVRHRRHAGQGAGRPRFAIVATHGLDLRVYKTRIRRAELEKIATELEAEIVYLPRGEHGDEADPESEPRKRRRHWQATDE